MSTSNSPMMTPAQLFMVRQQSINWALATAVKGEAWGSILRRADEYALYVLHPTRPDVVLALQEREGATIH